MPREAVTREDREDSARRLDAMIEESRERMRIFREGEEAGREGWPPCSNPWIGRDRQKAAAWARGRAAAAPGSRVARMREEFQREERESRRQYEAARARASKARAPSGRQGE